jgi:RHS repeat-associated protein
VRPVYQYRYDSYGNQVQIEDPRGKLTAFTYDHLGRQTSRTLPIGVDTTGVATDFVERMFYDDRRLNQVTGALSSSVAVGQLAFTVDFDGRVTEYLYDNTPEGGGRLIQKRFYAALSGGNQVTASMTIDQLRPLVPATPSPTTTYTLDALDRSVIVNDSLHGVTTNAYDAEGRVTQITSPEGTLHHVYDNLGRLARTYTGLVDSNGTNNPGDLQEITDTRYTYDRLNRLKTVQLVERNDTPTSETTTYVYDKVGNLDRVDMPNAVTSDYLYDNLNRLDLLQHFKDVGTQDKVYQTGDIRLAEFDYFVRADGKRTKVIEKDDLNRTTTIDWMYDALGRLKQEKFDSYDNTLDFTADYRFDLASNRAAKDIDKSSNGTLDEAFSYLYDANDRLTREQKNIQGTPTGDITTFYEYDNPLTPAANDGTQQTAQNVYGSIISAPTGSRSSFMTFGYDVRGRLAQVVVDTNGDTSGGQTTTTYLYNDDGVRIQQSVAGTVTKYHIDPNNHTGYAQILEEKNSAGTVTQTYTLGHDVLNQAVGATVYHLLYDGHGSTRALLNSTAGVHQRYAFDAYGKQLEGTDLTSADNATSRLLYSGEWTAIGSQLQYLRARWQRDGRFLAMDPFAGDSEDPVSLHKYLYVHSDPINGIDPTGQFFTAVGALVGMSVRTVVNNANVGGALIAIDRASSVADAVKLVSSFVATGAISPALLAGFVANFIPFGSLLNKATLVGRGAGELLGISDELTDIYRAVGQAAALSSKKATQILGEFGAVAVAKKMGFEAVTDFPIRYHGVDGLMRRGKDLVIIEAKGGGNGALDLTQHGMQLSQDWIRRQIQVLRERGYEFWADELDDAIRSGNLSAMKVHVPLDDARRALDPVFELKSWSEIGRKVF